MCGDGANDCGALRAAHAGVSLSAAEASVASPFTSRTANISCVPILLKEGRAALVTSFCVFKYIALYSIVQFISVLILTSKDARMGDYMFLYIDLVISTLVSLSMGNTKAYDRLVRKRPPSSLVSASSIFSLITHILIGIAFQVLATFYIQSQPCIAYWFSYVVPDDKNPGEPPAQTMLSTVIFCVSSYQYLTLAFVLSRSHPYRQRVWTNLPFTLTLSILTCVSALLILYPPLLLQQLFKLVTLPSMTVRLTTLGMSAIHFLLSFMLETYLVENGAFAFCFRRLPFKNTKQSARKAAALLDDDDPNWPPIGQTTYARTVL